MFGPVSLVLAVQRQHSTKIRALAQGRKRSPNPNVLVRIFSGGVGVFHVKVWGPKSWVCPLKPGKSNFLGGICRDFAGIGRRCPKNLRKIKFVFNSRPLLAHRCLQNVGAELSKTAAPSKHWRLIQNQFPNLQRPPSTHFKPFPPRRMRAHERYYHPQQKNYRTENRSRE